MDLVHFETICNLFPCTLQHPAEAVNNLTSDQIVQATATDKKCLRQSTQINHTFSSSVQYPAMGVAFTAGVSWLSQTVRVTHH